MTRRGFIKWTTALGVVGAAAVGIGAGYGADLLLRPTSAASTTTQTTTQTVTSPPQTLTTTATVTRSPSPVVKTYNMYKEQGALEVYTQDGVITRIQPLNGLPASNFQCAERWRTYSPDRLKYPMKRVGWAPGGKSGISNRGQGQFVRITWDEAFNSIESEFKRVQQTYGPEGFLYEPGEHSNSWFFHNRYLFMHDLLSFMGGYTSLGCDGLSWAATRPSGAIMAGVAGGYNTADLNHLLTYSKMLVVWSKNPIVTDEAMGCVDVTNNIFAKLHQAGIKIVYIGSNFDETAKRFADTWIPCHPYADEALAAAIANVWINESTYDQAYLNTHSVGFDEAHLPSGAPAGSSFKNYILGTSDGTPKTPEWAEPICGVKAREIRALARAWAAQPTALLPWRGARLNAGGYVRFMYTLLAMQGLGKPGICFGPSTGSQWQATVNGMTVFPSPGNWGERGFTWHDMPAVPYIPNVYAFYHVTPPELADKAMLAQGMDFIGHWPCVCMARVANPVTQAIRDVLWDKSMLASASNPIFHRFNIGPDSVLFQYPETGKSEVHLYISTGGNLLSRSPGATGIMKALLSPKFEFILALDPWMEPDDMFADIILPTVTNFERDDVSHWRQYEVYCKQAIQPLFEAKSDWDIWVELAKRMGVYDKFVDGKPTVEDWLHDNFDKVTTIGKHISWEDFKAQGIWEWTIPSTWTPAPPAAGWTFKTFNDDPVKNKLDTESGLLQIYSPATVAIGAKGQSGYYVQQDFSQEGTGFEKPNPGPDPLCPGIPMYLPNPEGPQSAWGKLYPIAMQTPHPKFAYHTCLQNVIWLQDEERLEINGHMYAPMVVNSQDAASRGIKNGDIVRAYNGRGQSLFWAHVSDLVMPGTAMAYYGRWPSFDTPGVPGALDRAGNVENLCRGGFISPFDNQQDVQCTVQYEKWLGSV